MCISGVNTLAINNISIESHIPLDRVLDDIVEESIECVIEFKTLNSERKGCEVVSSKFSDEMYTNFKLCEGEIKYLDSSSFTSFL